MQAGILLIATSGLLQQQAAPATTDTASAPIAAYAIPHWSGPAPTSGFAREYHLNGFDFPTIDTVPARRPLAVEHSQGYYTRLSIHRYASYATIPLFAAEYFVGQKLFNDTNNTSGLKGVHSGIAVGIYGLFGVNTITGVWTLWESRSDPHKRLRRYVHSILMIASDAGFVATAGSAPGGDRRTGQSGRNAAGASHHRTLAIASFSTATVGYLMMLIWK
jgi:hypothetical protein